MSKYTTGEIAKLCGVSVRTVQYYDERGILIPSELSEGGRRLYSEDDYKKLKIICFLRDAGISIKSIGELLSESNPSSVISVLLEKQEQLLQNEVKERQEQLAMLEGIKKALKGIENFSVESIGDIAYAMENKKKMKQLHAVLLITGIPLNIIQWVKGLSRYKVVFAKFFVMFTMWTIGYLLCFAVTYGYNAFFWDNSIAVGLLPAMVHWWLFGVWIIGLIVLFSVLVKSYTGVLLGTGGSVLGVYLISFFPKAWKYTPTTLMESASLLIGTKSIEDYGIAVLITILLVVICLIVSITAMNRKQL